MSYFVKVIEKSKGKYLQIYDSSWDSKKGSRVSKCYKTLGYEADLISQGIADPISFYKAECKRLNDARKNAKKESKAQKISDENVKMNIGSSIIYSAFKTLNLDRAFNLLALQFGHSYKIDEIFMDLVAGRILQPASKLKSYVEVIPLIYGKHDYNLDNIYQTLDDFGSDYQGVIEVVNHYLSKKYRIDTSNVFFDCTNFYFEIDKEDELRRKGPSKENRKDPIIGMGLLLDKNCMPISMRLYPGSRSEKPVQREIIDGMKKKGNIIGRTIVVADKGLNCAQNIYQALSNKDGYIYSKSVLQSKSLDKDWIFLDNDDHPESAYTRTVGRNGEVVFKIKSIVDTYKYKFEYKDENDGKVITKEFTTKEKRVVYFNKDLHDKKVFELNKMKSKLQDLILSKAKKEEYGAYGSYVSIESKSNDIKVSINQERFDMELKCAGYNMIVTSETEETDACIYDTYHRLWRIEETFRMMKTDLDARPVHVRLENRIYGHFLVCYMAVLIIRYLQFVVFKDKQVKSNEIIDYVRKTEVIKIDDSMYLNITKKNGFLDKVNDVSYVPCDNRCYKTDRLEKLFGSPLKLQ